MVGLLHSIRRSPWDWFAAALLGVNLAWTTWCLGGYRAETMVVTAVLSGLLPVAWLGRAWWSWRQRTPDGPPATDVAPHPAGWWLLPFLLYAAGNVAWHSPVRWLGWLDWATWLLLSGMFWAVLTVVRSRRAQVALLGVLLAVTLVGVAMAAYQSFAAPRWLMLHRVQVAQYAGRASGPFGIPNSFAALLLLVLPFTAVLALRRGATATTRVFFGWLALVFLFGLGLTISRGAWLGLAVALTVWPVIATRARLGRRLLLAATVLGAVALVGALAGFASPAVRTRFTQLVHEAGERSRPILWRGVAGIVREHPLLGSGGGSFDVAFERFRPDGFVVRPQWAHNDYLNTLSDYGALGFLLFFGGVGGIVWRCRRRGDHAAEPSEPSRSRRDVLDDPLVRQALVIGLLAFALQLSVDFHLKIPALALAVAVVAAILVQRTWPRATVAETRFAAAVGLSLAASCAAVWLLGYVPRYRAEAKRESARDTLDLLVGVDEASPRYRERLDQARRSLDSAVTLWPADAQAWADRAYARALASRLAGAPATELGRQAEADADRALQEAPVVAEFWIRRGVARDVQQRWADASPDFGRAIELAPKMPAPWYYDAYHLSLRPAQREIALAVAATCLRLDPKYAEAQRLRQRLATEDSRP